ncbi:hypothetical protein FKX85_03140 [Echinicola soli]|uniref:Uncharacterized protein n=1 Tax=Echinicola soli TaxID=2591634 RepID=A0A514CE36_9BACT|nr:hypothetical protein [Echinicola soli]QDH78083.1 hypothetical protein FKX85_03140 [Echinicola soli]
MIFQAARDYYYDHRFGLSSPPRNGPLNPQTKIAADITERQNDKPSHAAIYARTGGILPSIYIRTFEEDADRVYAVTAHELAHYAHWDMDRDVFRAMILKAYVPPFSYFSHIYTGTESYVAVIESWARGVEWMFAQERYKNKLKIEGYEYGFNIFISGKSNGNYQEQKVTEYAVRSIDKIYTPTVVDMIDEENQRYSRGHGGSMAYPMDRVSGYTIKQIENGLKGASSWEDWLDNMKIRENNSTEGYLEELFGNWY